MGTYTQGLEKRKNQNSFSHLSASLICKLCSNKFPVLSYKWRFERMSEEILKNQGFFQSN